MKNSLSLALEGTLLLLPLPLQRLLQVAMQLLPRLLLLQQQAAAKLHRRPVQCSRDSIAKTGCKECRKQLQAVAEK